MDFHFLAGATNTGARKNIKPELIWIMTSSCCLSHSFRLSWITHKAFWKCSSCQKNHVGLFCLWWLSFRTRVRTCSFTYLLTYLASYSLTYFQWLFLGSLQDLQVFMPITKHSLLVSSCFASYLKMAKRSQWIVRACCGPLFQFIWLKHTNTRPAHN